MPTIKTGEMSYLGLNTKEKGIKLIMYKLVILLGYYAMAQTNPNNNHDNKLNPTSILSNIMQLANN